MCITHPISVCVGADDVSGEPGAA